ncbi:unnamed protein product [Mucor hiemalis]
MPSGTVTPTTPDSPTVFDVVKEIENREPFIEDEASHAIDDDDDDVVYQPKTIKTFYNQKCILITGASGFIGKAVLWKLFQLLGNSVDKIFVLLRKSRQHQRSAKDRLHDDILSNKAFVSLRRSMGSTLFDELVDEKLFPVFGDLTETNIGLSEEDVAVISSQINVIYHCAGNVDGSETIENSVKINTFGTLQLLNIANQCHSMAAFIYLSNIQQFDGKGWKTTDEKYLYPLPSKSANNILNEIMEDGGSQYDEFLTLYSNSYLFSKSLTEHILVDHVLQNKENGVHQFPIGILRLSPVGPSVQEPLIGWADGVNGVNGTILLTGKGNKVIQPHIGDGVADVVPVDYVARLIIGCAATLSVSETFEVPQVIQTPDAVTANVPEEPAANPARMHKRSSSQVSRISIRSSTIYHQTRVSLPGHQEQTIKTVPVIFQVSISNMRPVTWRIGYEAIRQYWTKATNINLPSSAAYFGNSYKTQTMNGNGQAPGLSRARTVMNSLRGFYMNAGAENATVSNANVTPMPSRSNERAPTGPSTSSSSLANKRNSHRLSRTVDKAAKLAHTMKDNIYSTQSGSNSHNRLLNENTQELTFAVRDIDIGMEFDPNVIVPEDADAKFWVNYFTNASYGMHYYVCQETQQRLPTPVYGWSCGIQPSNSAIGDEDSGYYQYVLEDK